mmetsp:Transcript_34272/g.98806  ORF Transcript_34272/g.98806 Transcript_34272/m.98806 type:complete len:224 (+) Transcript_34272:72-743(+)
MQGEGRAVQDKAWFWEKLRLACAERALELDMKIPNNLHNDLVRSNPEMFAYDRVRERETRKVLAGAAGGEAQFRDIASRAAHFAGRSNNTIEDDVEPPTSPPVPDAVPPPSSCRPSAPMAPTAPPAFLLVSLSSKPQSISGVSLVTGKPLPPSASGSADLGGSTRSGSALTSVRSVVSSSISLPHAAAGPPELSKDAVGSERGAMDRSATKDRPLNRPPRPCA